MLLDVLYIKLLYSTTQVQWGVGEGGRQTKNSDPQSRAKK